MKVAKDVVMAEWLASLRITIGRRNVDALEPTIAGLQSMLRSWILDLTCRTSFLTQLLDLDIVRHLTQVLY